MFCFFLQGFSQNLFSKLENYKKKKKSRFDGKAAFANVPTNYNHKHFNCFVISQKVMSIFENPKINLGVMRKLYSTEH